LQGEFALVHIKNNNNGDNAWLLIKHRDEFAKSTDITKKNKSVISGKTIIQMAGDKKAGKWISNRKKTTKVKARRSTN